MNKHMGQQGKKEKTGKMRLQTNKLHHQKNYKHEQINLKNKSA